MISIVTSLPLELFSDVLFYFQRNLAFGLYFTIDFYIGIVIGYDCVIYVKQITRHSRSGPGDLVSPSPSNFRVVVSWVQGSRQPHSLKLASNAVQMLLPSTSWQRNSCRTAGQKAQPRRKGLRVSVSLASCHYVFPSFFKHFLQYFELLYHSRFDVFASSVPHLGHRETIPFDCVLVGNFPVSLQVS